MNSVKRKNEKQGYNAYMCIKTTHTQHNQRRYPGVIHHQHQHRTNTTQQDSYKGNGKPENPNNIQHTTALPNKDNNIHR